MARAAVEGLGPVAHDLRVDVSTISRWCSKAGVVLPSSPPPVGPAAGQAIAAADHARRVTIAQRKASLAAKLGELADLGVDVALAKLRTAKDSPAESELSVRDAVGAFTRAIHDLQLLDGQATERHDSPAVPAGGATAAGLLEAANQRVGALRALPPAREAG